MLRGVAAVLALLAVGALSAQQPAPKKSQKPAAATPPAKGQAAGKANAKQAPAQVPLPRIRTSDFTTPDGSRFLLILDPSVSHVHWAIASWADGSEDPPGLSGLTMAAARASLNGTWNESSDANAERQLLQALDAAWLQQLLTPADPKVRAEVVRLDQAAEKLGGGRTFQRLLAAAPALQPEVINREPFAVLALTTIEPALASIAKLLVARREQQALRGLLREWMPSVMERAQTYAANPRWLLKTETLALLMPTSPAIAQLEKPVIAAPSRTQALAAWQASQHPTQTVHVLLGNFNEANTKAMLAATFATTELPQPTTRRATRPRPPSNQRRSVVPGIGNDGGVIAWVLPAVQDPWALQLAQRWLNDENGSLRRMLRQQSPTLTIDCQMPWPTTTNGQSLLLFDVKDPSGQPGWIEAVLAACKSLTAKPFANGQFYQSYLQLDREWNARANSPRAIAMDLAERALMWPSLNLNEISPAFRKGEVIYPILKAAFQSQPAIVESKR